MGMLDNRISDEDRQRVIDRRNPPEFEAGFSDSDMASGSDSFDMDSLFGTSDSFGGSNDPFSSSSGGFGSSNDPFASSNGGGFGGSNDPFSNSGNNGFGSQNNGFGNQNNGFGGFGQSPFGNQQQQQVQQTPDTIDKAIDAGIDTAKNIGEIMLEMAKSLRLRNADDFGYLSRNSIIAGFSMLVIGIVSGIIGAVGSVKMLSFIGIGGQVALCGGLLATSGICGIGISALILEKIGRSNTGSIDDIPDVPAGDDNFTDEFEDNIGDEVEDLFGSELDGLFEDGELEDLMSSNDNDSSQSEEEEEFNPDVDTPMLNLSNSLENVQENQYVSRETLFNTFKPMFPKNTPDFSKKTEISVGSNDFTTLETICLKALANVANCQLEEIDSSLEKASESFFSYELRLKRISKVKKTDDLAREIEAYMRENSEDEGVNATVDIEGDFYKIIVTKGESAIVTFGDIFTQRYCCDFFLDNKNKLPMITGIDELGKVIVDDAKNFDTMLIAGKPRSGKSWYVLSILMSLMLFNTPEDVQFCIIDPKESNLFKTIALMPHVCGLHNDEHILDILDDIIEIEAPRRKRLLSDNRCDDIWALRKKGIKLPVLYVVIDEYITVLNNLDKDQQKEFDNKIQVLISQLPSQGIRLIFVPHRATGVVNKTNRTMLQFTAAVRADSADVIDTLGIQKWTRALTKAGDIAVKNSSMKSAAYVRGAALTTDDGDNTIFIETAAKVFYKMGVDIPDMSNMRIACNRDEEHIRQELGGEANRVQFNADDLDNLANVDFNNL